MCDTRLTKEWYNLAGHPVMQYNHTQWRKHLYLLKRIHDPSTWETGRTECAALGAATYMVAVQTAEEQQHVSQVADQNGQCLGGVFTCTVGLLVPSGFNSTSTRTRLEHSTKSRDR